MQQDSAEVSKEIYYTVVNNIISIVVASAKIVWSANYSVLCEFVVVVAILLWKSTRLLQLNHTASITISYSAQYKVLYVHPRSNLVWIQLVWWLPLWWINPGLGSGCDYCRHRTRLSRTCQLMSKMVVDPHPQLKTVTPHQGPYGALQLVALWEVPSTPLGLLLLMKDNMIVQETIHSSAIAPWPYLTIFHAKRIPKEVSQVSATVTVRSCRCGQWLLQLELYTVCRQKVTAFNVVFSCRVIPTAKLISNHTMSSAVAATLFCFETKHRRFRISWVAYLVGTANLESHEITMPSWCNACCSNGVNTHTSLMNWSFVDECYRACVYCARVQCLCSLSAGSECGMVDFPSVLSSGSDWRKGRTSCELTWQSYPFDPSLFTRYFEPGHVDVWSSTAAQDLPPRVGCMTNYSESYTGRRPRPAGQHLIFANNRNMFDREIEDPPIAKGGVTKRITAHRKHVILRARVIMIADCNL